MTPWLPCRLPAEAGGKGLPPPRPAPIEEGGGGRFTACAFYSRPPSMGAGQGGGPVDFLQKQGAIETGFLVRLGKGSPPPRPLSGGHISEELLAVPRFSPSPPWRARAIAFAKVVLV